MCVIEEFLVDSLFQKFKSLEKRTNEVTKRSTEKRIKHLQKTALENGLHFKFKLHKTLSEHV